jgi:predicted DCC family thiol-disulfide oxidoreductase YuxK
VEDLTLGCLESCDAKVDDVTGHYTLKQALSLVAMDACTLPRKSLSRGWWRYGWAWGFLGRSIEDLVYAVREKRYRGAARMGWAEGRRARCQVDSVGTNA